MAEVVQYHLEQMVPELEDLERQGLFTKGELQAVVRKRTKFEYSLRRRRVASVDFLRYVEYEINVDALRRQRKRRLGSQGWKTSVSDFSITQRVISIFERAVARHQEDAQLWRQFIEFVKSRRRMEGEEDEESEGHTRLLSRLFARAIVAHPYDAQMWVWAAAHELEANANGSAARTLLQRALRLAPHSKMLWIEYFRLELLLVEKVRARRRILGIDGSSSGEKDDDGSEKDDDGEKDRDGPDTFIDLPQLDEEDDGSLEGCLVERELARLSAKQGGALAEDARAAMSQQTNMFLQGAVAQIVHDQAIAAHPMDLELRQELVSVARLFPDMDALTDHVLDAIRRDFAGDAEAQAFLCAVPLSGVSASSPQLVDALQKTIEGFGAVLNTLDTPEMWAKYVEFLVQWRDVCAGENREMQSLHTYFTKLLDRAVAAIGGKRDRRLNAELALMCADVLGATDNSEKQLMNWLGDMTQQRFPESADLWHRRLALLVQGAKEADARRIDALFTDQALVRAPRSQKLWDLWLDWTESSQQSGRISLDQVQAQYMAAMARVTQQRALAGVEDELARVLALCAHLQVRLASWAWKLPQRARLSAYEHIARPDITALDEDDDDADNSDGEDEGPGNADALRQVYRNVTRHAFPTLGFYRRCIQLEPEAKKKQSLHEMACRVDERDTKPWLAYLRFLMAEQQLAQAANVFWRASQMIPDGPSRGSFELAYQALLQK
ncbi:U3 snoRNP protein [Coemansia sp. RSA 552]|nr:U3 snoRNP protein [Coemansia sp. RSA 552]